VVHRRAASAANQVTCRVADPALHHALKPNCAFVEHWGHDSYDYFTNSLGFRDERIRQVELTDPARASCCSAIPLPRARAPGPTALPASWQPACRNMTSSTVAAPATLRRCI